MTRILEASFSPVYPDLYEEKDKEKLLPVRVFGRPHRNHTEIPEVMEWEAIVCVFICIILLWAAALHPEELNS